MRTLISFAALLLSVAFVQLGSGSLGPLDALAGTARGFSPSEIGLLGSAHFIGFFIGCWATPRLMGSIGHSRAFAALAAVGAIAALMHPVIDSPVAWAVLRIGTGMAVAGAYTVVESWLQAKVDNANRGRVLGVYRLVDLGASVAAQGVVALLDPASYVAYNLIAALCCLCLLPLTLTTSKPPSIPASPRLAPLKLFRVSPLAGVAVMVTGVTNAGFRMAGPIYALESGLNATQVALFMIAGVSGGALAQWPAGWLSDKFDRRRVLIGLSVAAIGVSILSAYAGAAYWVAFFFGFATFPMFSIAAAHANDFGDGEQAVEISAALMFVYGVGAIASPLVASTLIESYGPAALFVFVAGAHILLILFSVWRMTRRALSGAKTPHRYVPRTTFTIAHLFKSRRDE
ncbi:MAG: MFS transporter [Pseudomonadota bacterium]